jgi:hypothetical protein
MPGYLGVELEGLGAGVSNSDGRHIKKPEWPLGDFQSRLSGATHDPMAQALPRDLP